MGKVRKAVIPAGGFGTRMLPATKVVPKELLPIVDKPLIQFIVEEIVESGIEEVILITGREKGSIEDHFDSFTELELFLEKNKKEDLLDMVKRLSSMVRIVAVRQSYPMGLGHAVLCARSLINDEPFAVLLPDDLSHRAEALHRAAPRSFQRIRQSGHSRSGSPGEARLAVRHHKTSADKGKAL